MPKSMKNDSNPENNDLFHMRNKGAIEIRLKINKLRYKYSI